LENSAAFLKAPVTTPQGGGFKSLNVTIRKTLGLYANVRPCVAYAPFVATRHPQMDVVVVRENEEDVYAGIEHRQTQEVMQCLKLISRPGCEKIVRYAFDYAQKHNRQRVTCFTKDNIMKLTDGLFHQVFDEIAPQYPDIETEHMIVDIGAAKARRYARSLRCDCDAEPLRRYFVGCGGANRGFDWPGGNANIGTGGAMFEAIHGSAPDIAGKNLAIRRASFCRR
jgi:isocitrate dehydrogenase